MEWMSGWIQGIIIAVIISTIIEMILPEGTSKKYIKVVIGVYILFSIISPVISKVTGNEFRVSDMLDLEKYMKESKSDSMQKQLSNQNQNQIKDIYLSSIKNDIKQKVENKGYQVQSVNLEVENDDEYTLKQLKLQISKEAVETNSNGNVNKNTNQIIENVQEVNINVGNCAQTVNSTTQNKKSAISNQNRRELKDYLSGVYEISTKNIFINE